MSGAFNLAKAARAAVGIAETVAPGDALARVSAMAAQLVDARKKVADLTADLNTATGAVTKLEMEDIPELMRELKLKSVGLDDGSKVEIIDDFHCGITEENKNPAYTWVREQGDGGIIKTEVGAAFGRGELADAEAFAAKAQQLTNHPVTVSEAIHFQTLKAYLREKREKGLISGDIAAMFGIHPFTKAKLTPPKIKKQKG